ncbi:hypothetical protein DFH09DRAFT_1285203, partial [Mycena vulgaris]
MLRGGFLLVFCAQLDDLQNFCQGFRAYIPSVIRKATARRRGPREKRWKKDPRNVTKKWNEKHNAPGQRTAESRDSAQEWPRKWRTELQSNLRDDIPKRDQFNRIPRYVLTSWTNMTEPDATENAREDKNVRGQEQGKMRNNWTEVRRNSGCCLYKTPSGCRNLAQENHPAIFKRWEGTIEMPESFLDEGRTPKDTREELLTIAMMVPRKGPGQCLPLFTGFPFRGSPLPPASSSSRLACSTNELLKNVAIEPSRS